jgi:hypothetical protein
MSDLHNIQHKFRNSDINKPKYSGQDAREQLNSYKHVTKLRFEPSELPGPIHGI